MSAYLHAVSITDKRGQPLKVWTLTTLEREGERERLGWALVAGRDEKDAARRARRLWPSVTLLGICATN